MLEENADIAHAALRCAALVVEETGYILRANAEQLAAVHEKRHRVLGGDALPLDIRLGLTLAFKAARAIFGNLLQLAAPLFRQQVEESCHQLLRLQLDVTQLLRVLRPGVGLLDNGVDESLAARVLHLIRRHHLLALHLRAREALNAAEQREIAPPDEGHGLALAPGAGRAADAVHVVLRVAGQLKVHHDVHIVDIEPAGRDVRRHQHAQIALAERVHHALAQRLGHVTVQAIDRVAACQQAVHDVIHHALGVRKHQTALHAAHLNQAAEYFDAR